MDKVANYFDIYRFKIKIIIQYYHLEVLFLILICVSKTTVLLVVLINK